MVLIAEQRNRQIDRQHRAVVARLGLGELDRPARIAVLLAQLGGLVLPILRDAASLDRLLLVLAVVLARRGNQAGIEICPDMAM